MRVLIIGGNRFFGRHLAKVLVAAGDKVTLLNRGNFSDGFGPAVDRLVADRRDTWALKTALGTREFDLVVDQVCFTAKEAAAACDVFASRTPTYIATSTLSVYELGPELIEEDFDPYSYEYEYAVEATDNYGEAKRQMESVFFKTAPFRVIAPRFPIVCGDDDYTGRLQFHIDHILKREPFRVPNLSAHMSFINSIEAGSALAFLGKNKNFCGPINCSSPDAISIKTSLHWIERATHTTCNLAPPSSDAPRSPYGVNSDYFMSTSRLQNLGYRISPLDKWLPALITQLTERSQLQV